MTRNSLVRTLVLLLVATVFASAVQAQGWKGRGRAQGRIVDESDQPIEGVKVTLVQASSGDGPDPFFTNKAGKFGYLGLAGGTWDVTCEKDGMVTAVGTVEISEFGSSPSVTIPMRPIPESVLQEQAASEAVVRLQEGNQLLQEGKFQEARTSYESALEDLEPEYHADILMAIARTYYQEDNSPEAIASLERLLAVDPENLDGLKLIINLLIAEDRGEEAQVYMAKLPEGESLDPDAYLNVGIEAYNAGNLEIALEQFDQAVANFPDNPDGFYYRGLIYLAQQSNEAAAADLQRYLELAPEGSHVEEVTSFLEYLQSDQ
jgi:tetratricopeptide (TPR) repeat protein